MSMLVVFTLASVSYGEEPAGQGTEILKIGFIGWLEMFIGIDTLHCVQVSVDMINQRGGLDIGGKNYMIKLISYTSNNEQSTIMAATNRLIFRDNVKFIICDGFGVDAVFPITEANKVVLCSSALSPAILSPNNHYSFMCGFQNTGSSSVVGWFAKNFPGKNILFGLPETQQGTVTKMVLSPVFTAFDVKADFEFYPAETTDLSALGTKIKMMNPDVFASVGGTNQPYAAVRQAGYKGMLFNPSTPTLEELLTVLSPEMLEGFISAASPTEFEPALTKRAQDFKAGWIEKFGSWTNPYLSVLSNFDCMVAALQKAGSPDPDKVAGVISNGLEFDSATGPGQMISRPDLGNKRTIDSIQAIYMKKIEGGKARLLTTIEIAEGLEYFRKANPAAAHEK